MPNYKKTTRKPAANSSRALPTIVSLFSGAGGLDHGFASAGFKISAAFDVSGAAVKTHKKNFPKCKAIVADLVKLRPSGVSQLIRTTLKEGSSIGIIGGPPCQGFSRANTRSVAADPRNELSELYTDIVRELQQFYKVKFIVFENVLGIRDKKHALAYTGLLKRLHDLNFNINEQQLCALDYGVPQNRKRIILSAMKNEKDVLHATPRKRKGKANVREAIGSLPAPTFFSRNLSPTDILFHLRNRFVLGTVPGSNSSVTTSGAISPSC